MTQKQIEQTRVIAEKDGWKAEHPFMKYADGSSVIAPQPPYLTDLNALHSVAMDVMEELGVYHLIKGAMAKRPINGQYIDLFNAVYDGIIYINQSKTTPQERG